LFQKALTEREFSVGLYPIPLKHKIYKNYLKKEANFRQKIKKQYLYYGKISKFSSYSQDKINKTHDAFREFFQN
jgi:hypothetical protein